MGKGSHPCLSFFPSYLFSLIPFFLFFLQVFLFYQLITINHNLHLRSIQKFVSPLKTFHSPRKTLTADHYLRVEYFQHCSLTPRQISPHTHHRHISTITTHPSQHSSHQDDWKNHRFVKVNFGVFYFFRTKSANSGLMLGSASMSKHATPCWK